MSEVWSNIVYCVRGLLDLLWGLWDILSIVLFVGALIAVVISVSKLVYKLVARRISYCYVDKDDVMTPLYFMGLCLFFGVFVGLNHGVTISNWFLASPGMFGKRIGGYEQEYVDRQYPQLDWEEWYSQESDGQIVVPIKVRQPLRYFGEYKLGLLPVSKRSFWISGRGSNAGRGDYNEVKSFLTDKYGKPVEENEDICIFESGNRGIRLEYEAFACVLDVCVWRKDLEKRLPLEKQELEERRKRNKIDAL